MRRMLLLAVLAALFLTAGIRPELFAQSQPAQALPPMTLKVGDNAPNFTLRDQNGKDVSLEDFNGKLVFLNFWGTSCPPCLAEMPGIEKLEEALRGEPIAFLAVTQDEEHTVRRFLRKVPLHLPVYLADTETPEEFGPPAVPRTFILDCSGHEVFRAVGALNWDDEAAREFLRKLEAR